MTENKYLTDMKFRSKSFQDTINYGKKFGGTLIGGEVVLLSGSLGSGKTAFTKGIALGLGINENVTSPSFSIMNEYIGKIRLYHFDFYRIDDKLEIEDLLEDYIYKIEGVTVIEWGEKIISRLNIYFLVHFELINSNRLLTIVP